MPKPLVILEAAEVEAHEAWLTYQRQSSKAAVGFQTEFDEAVEKIREDPDRWPEYLFGTSYYLMRRYPYLLVFDNREDEIRLIAVAHGFRREGYWKNRR